MKHFVKNYLLFVLLAILIFTSINIFQSTYNAEPTHYRKQYESIINNANVYNGIIIGTSHASHSLRPTILDASGIRYYNYSLNGSNPEFHYKWYKSFIHYKEIKPKYCLYAFDFFMFDKDLLWRRFEQDVEYFPAHLFVNELLNNDNFNKFDLIVNRFPFLKYRRQIKQSLKLERGSPQFDSNTYDRGYISFSIPFDSIQFKPKLNYKIDPIQVGYFKLLLKQMLEDNVNIIFVMTPQYGINVNEYYQMESLKIIDYISKELDIPVLNYNTGLGLEFKSYINTNINYFSDWGHMNHNGANIFSNAIAKEIKARTHNIVYEK